MEFNCIIEKGIIGNIRPKIYVGVIVDEGSSQTLNFIV